MALACTPENFRAEMHRHMLRRADVCNLINMRLNRFTDYVNGNLPLTDWAGHNIGWGINAVTGRRVFAVDDSRGVVIPPRGRPRLPPHRGLGLDPYIPAARRKYRRRFTQS